MCFWEKYINQASFLGIMKRKIVKNGIATLTVSLPAKWAKDHGLKAGDELNVLERGPFLEVGALQTKNVKRKTIIVKATTSTYLTIATIAAYRAGYDEIELKVIDDELIYKSKELVFRKNKEPHLINTLEFINALATYFVGMEIIHQDSTKVILKDMSNYENIDLESIYWRIVDLVKEAGESFLKSLETGYEQHYKNQSAIEFNINKLCNYYMRCLVKSHFPNVKEDLATYQLIALIENSSDVYWDILKISGKYNYKYKKQNYSIFKKTTELLNKSIRIAPKGKPQELLDFYHELKDFIKPLDQGPEPDAIVVELKRILIQIKEIIHYAVMKNI